MNQLCKKSLSFLLILSICISAFSQTTLIAAGSSWKYLDNGSNQASTWTTAAFNDAAWASGNAQLGFGDGDETTIVSYGSNVSAKYITTYFRKAVAIADASVFSNFTFTIKRDDGIVLYVNGVEKYRNNMPSGTIAYTTLASAAVSDDGNTWQIVSLSAGSFVNGNNIIAVEIHQNTGTSSDLSFDLALTGTPVPVQTGGLIASGSAWKYLDNGTNQGTAWTGAGFSDATWASGNAQLGYGDGDEATVVGYGGNTNARYITTYFRKMISVTNATNFGSYTLNVKRDDGIIVYVNGIERYRNNMPTGTVTYTTVASGAASDDGASWQTATLAAGIFVTGSNVIAVEVHQSSGTSTDLSFDLELKGNPPSAAVLKRGPYLQVGTPNSVFIRWRTDIANDTKVSYGLSAGTLTSVVSNNTPVTEHEIQLTGLTPNTKYFYSVGSSSQVLQGDANNFFITAPVTGTEKKTRIWVNGDCGNNSTNQKNVRDQFLNYMATNTTDVWLLLGDNAYDNGTDAEYQSKFFDIYKDKLLKQTVLWPSPGNHEYASNATRMNDHAIAYYDIFTMPKTAQAGGVPSNTEAFYSFNYGNIHFISLDSYGKEVNTYRLYDTLGPQVVWLKQDLAANTQKWTIVYWHHAPYTLSDHNSDTETELKNIRENLLTILERYKVDLVLCGHSHGYERSKLMKGHYGNEASFTASMNVSQSSGKYDGSVSSCPYIKKNPSSYNGTVYVVAGSAGQLNTTSQAAYPHAAMYYSNIANGGSMVLEIEANRLDAKWICSDGVIRDKFTIEKDVSVKKNISIAPGGSTTLTASWIGNYNWTGGAVTRSITVSPAASTTYIVTDGMNCIADTFIVTVTAARPVNKMKEPASVSSPSIKIYPNPARGYATIEYTSPAEGYVNLDIMDITGRKIKTLVSQFKKAGTYQYVINTKSERIKAGIYSVNLTAGTQRKMQQFIITEE